MARSIVALVAAFAMAGCTLDSSTLTTPTPTATTAPHSTALPLPGGGTVAPSDELLVYTTKTSPKSPGAIMGTATADSQTRADRRVEVYDVTQNNIVSSFGFGTKEDPAVRAVLAGDEIVTATKHKVVLQRLDGTVPRQIYFAPPTGAVLDIDVSQDGKLLGIVARSEESNPQTAIVRVLYLSSGGSAMTLAVGDPRFAKFQGTFEAIHWRATSKGEPESFVLAGALDSSNAGDGQTASDAIVTINGVVQVLVPSGEPWLSASGSSWAMTDQLVCTGDTLAGHHLLVKDVDSDQVLWQTDDQGPLYTPVEWSPDGETLVYAERTGSSASCKTGALATVQLFQVDLQTKQASALADLTALHQKWYGQALIQASCANPYGPVTGRWQHFAPLCLPDSTGPVTVTAGGSKAGEAIDPIPVGIINSPSQQQGEQGQSITAVFGTR